MRFSSRSLAAITLTFLSSLMPLGASAAEPSTRIYHNVLTPIENPQPLLADYPQYVQPIEELHRFEAPILVDDADADLDVRAWRFSYNARGIIEVPNRLDGRKTAIIVVHPWGIDDGQGWKMPEPAGVAFACTFEKNELIRQHAAEIINPFLEQHREHVGLVLYSLPGPADDIRTRLYRSTMSNPSDEERSAARDELTRTLESFNYHGEPVPAEIPLTGTSSVVDYFQAFRGIDSSARYNGEGFWELPIPVMTALDVHHDDVVLYDEQGYPELKQFLQAEGIEHILLCGYATDMCVCRTTAGYENLRQDFNVFLVGDATQATCPANVTSAYATNQSLSYASLELFITQVSAVRYIEE